MGDWTQRTSPLSFSEPTTFFWNPTALKCFYYTNTLKSSRAKGGGNYELKRRVKDQNTSRAQNAGCQSFPCCSFLQPHRRRNIPAKRNKMLKVAQALTLYKVHIRSRKSRKITQRNKQTQHEINQYCIKVHPCHFIWIVWLEAANYCQEHGKQMPNIQMYCMPKQALNYP